MSHPANDRYYEAKHEALQERKEKVGRKMDSSKFNTFVGKDAKQMAAESNAYNKRHNIKGKYYAK